MGRPSSGLARSHQLQRVYSASIESHDFFFFAAGPKNFLEGQGAATSASTLPLQVRIV